MPTTNPSQQTIEPVHVRADQPVVTPTPGPALPVAPAPITETRAPQAAVPSVSHPIVPKPASPQQPKGPQKQTDGSVGKAIFATVVIVLGLASLAVVAYMNTQK